MAVERAPAGASLIDVLDRVLDKGIVIDAYVRVSLVGIDLVSVEARIVVASVETYLRFAEAIGVTGFASRPAMAPVSSTQLPPGAPTAADLERVMAENAELRRRLDELS
jgi:gas vesicle structural protein